MAGRKRKLGEEAITEILVADTDSEPGSEASNFEDYLQEEGGGGEEEEEEEGEGGVGEEGGGEGGEEEAQAVTSGGLPTWGLPQGWNTNIHPFAGPAKGVEKK
jgi:hypothetical protein